jgi:hypothetical protein
MIKIKKITAKKGENKKFSSLQQKTITGLNVSRVRKCRSNRPIYCTKFEKGQRKIYLFPATKLQK